MASLRAARPVIRAVVARTAPPAATVKRAVPIFKAAAALPSRSFTSSVPRFGSGENFAVDDQMLVNALAQEQEYEKENVVEDAQALAEQLGVGKTWEVSDRPGGDIVTLTRKFGSESIKIIFRVSDWADISPEDEAGMADEDAEGLSTLPITVTITKSGAPGAMYIEADAGREGISLTNVTVHEKAIAEQVGAEGEHERSNAYAGPHYHELDEELQTALGNFMEERDFNENLGSFIVSYTELKEQKDYVNWLDQVKGFVQA